MNKKITEGVNAPVLIWLTNEPNAYILVSKLYIWVHLRDGQQELEYKIDAERLWNQIKRWSGERIPVGDLDFWNYYNQMLAETVAVLEPSDEVLAKQPDLDSEFRFQCEVPLRELENAVAKVKEN